MKDNWVTTIGAVLISLAAFYALYGKLGWHPVVSGIITIVLYFALDLLLRPRRKLGGVDVETMRGGEILAALEDAKQDLHKMQITEKFIQDEKVRQDSQNLRDSGEQLVKYLCDNPEKMSLARRFLNYYLDLAVDIIDHYVKLQESKLQTDDVKDAMERCAHAIPQLDQAFEKQHTSLIKGEILNLEADIKVLEDTLRMEDL